MFSIGCTEWPGTSKLIEEQGELIQVLGKLIGSRGDTNHWSGDLRAKLVEEIGDLYAALEFFLDFNDLDNMAIEAQRERKYNTFVEWHLNEDPLY